MGGFQRGKILRLKNGDIIEITNILKQGGQGIIYEINYKNKKMALKWLNCKSATNNFALKDSVDKLKKLKIDGFTMPIEVTDTLDGQFGYIMDLIPSDYVSVAKIIYDEGVDFKTKIARLNTPEMIARCFKSLHDLSLSFMDISDTNVFVNLKKPDVFICDCDNVAMTGTKPNVKGTTGFMAPELMKFKGSNPNIKSDRFSLAILLFLILVRHKPFEGTGVKGIIDEEKDHDIYGNPLFVFHPTDQSNRPDDVHTIERWERLPQYLKNEFERTFIDGCTDVDNRTTADEWCDLLNRWSIEENESQSVDSLSLDSAKVKRRFQPVFFIVDCSGSMITNNRIDSVNSALNRFCKQINNIENTDVYINILYFSNDAHWFYDCLKKANTIGKIDIKIGGRSTNFTSACINLDLGLKKDDFLQREKSPNKPLIVLLTDGYDYRTNYLNALGMLHDNIWFSKSEKIAIGINGDGDSTTMLVDFTGDKNKVRNSSDNIELSNYIYALTMTVARTLTQNQQNLDAVIRDLR